MQAAAENAADAEVTRTSMHFLLPLLVLAVAAHDRWVSESHNMVCLDMQARDAAHGGAEPYVRVNVQEADSEVSVAVIDFWSSRDNTLHVKDGHRDVPVLYYCERHAMGLQYCHKDDLGRYMFSREAHRLLNMTEVAPGSNASYPVTQSRRYCVAVALKGRFSGTVHFHNPWGNLAGYERMMVWVSGGLAFLYALCVAGYGMLSRGRRDRFLPIQRVLFAWLVFLLADYVIQWAYYHAKNRSGMTGTVHKAWGVVLVLQSTKYAGTWFLLALVAHGYGVSPVQVERRVVWENLLFGVATFAASAFKAAPGYVAYPRHVEGRYWVPLVVVTAAWFGRICACLYAKNRVRRAKAGTDAEEWFDTFTLMYCCGVLLVGEGVIRIIGMLTFRARSYATDSLAHLETVLAANASFWYAVVVVYVCFLVQPSPALTAKVAHDLRLQHDIETNLDSFRLEPLPEDQAGDLVRDTLLAK